MKLTTLTCPQAVFLQTQFASRDEAIRQLAQRLTGPAKITNPDAFLAEVFRRETLAPPHWAKGWRYHMAKRRR